MNKLENTKQAFAALAACLLLTASCGSDEPKVEEPADEGSTTPATEYLQLNRYGVAELPMESSDSAPFTFTFSVERQGTDASVRRTAALSLWTQDKMDNYNAVESHSYTVLPASLFTMEPASVVLEEGETQTEVTFSLNPADVFEAVKESGSHYAVGLTLESEDAKIVSTRCELVLDVALNYPSLEIELPDEMPIIAPGGGNLEWEIATNFSYRKDGQEVGCPSVFTCKLAVPANAAQLVADYNAAHQSRYELLPADCYDLGADIRYTTGERQKTATVTFFRDKIEATAVYLLPLVLADPSDESVFCANDVYYLSFGHTYTNPITHDGSHADPTVLRAQDGYFYLYNTEGGTNNGGLGIFRSPDLLEWEHVGKVIENNYLSWIDLKKTDLWAPEARYINGKYYVYFSVSSWGGLEVSSIGVATSDNPAGPFTDSGNALITYDDLGVLNSIDPFYWEEGGKKYLFWGSFHGIYVTELTDDGLSVRRNADGTPTLLQKVAGSAYEGTCIYKKNGYYYFLASVGSCCAGESSTYHVVVGRSTNLLGPYINRSGKQMLDNQHELVFERNDAFVGPGHNSQILTDDAGTEWIIYHGYPMPDVESRSLLMDRLLWSDDGWPYIEGKSPSSTPQVAPVIHR